MIGKRRRALKRLAREYGIENLWVFGSVARHRAGPGSDVDLLFRPERPLGLLGRVELKERAGALLGRKVDLATEATLHWLIRPTVLKEAVPL